ncbi:NepR family anti-sigma factor [Actibacterium sp. D379-3]
MSKKAAKTSAEQMIDDNLRKVYQSLADDGVPDKFHELLRALREQDQKKGDGN